MNKENSQSPKHPVHRLYQFLELEKRDINLLIVLTFGYGILGIATPISVQTLVNIVAMGGVLQPLYVVSLILFVLLLLSGVLYVFEVYVVELIQRRLFVRTSINIAKKAQGVDASIYDHSNPVEFMNRFFDVSIIQKATATLLTVGLAALLQGLIGSVILIFYSVYFAIIVLVLLVLLAFIIIVLGRRAINTAIEESKAKYATGDWLETIARNFYVFKFYYGLDRAKRISNAMAGDYLEARKKHFSTLLFQNIGAVTLYAIVGTLMLALGGGLVIKGQINLGQFVAAELIIFGVLAAFVRFVSKLEYFYDMVAALDKVGLLDDLPQEIIGAQEISKERFNQLEAMNLTFNYSTRISLFKNLSFTLATAESIAILGKSGAGKTTLISLISGLRKPINGHITFGGNDLRQLNQNTLRNAIGIAGRVEVMDGSIIENVILDRAHITFENVNWVLAELGLQDDFAKLEDGLDTKLTAFGAPLSTTQLQRLMLARAIVGEPRLLIIDGLLDNLTDTELNSVMRLLEKHKASWMLIVTTRFASIARQFNHTLTLNQRDAN
ncbi:MAG: ABC transporter [Methylotenera sp.]|nr:MAG: ABC transporter [Methylotenera sp.]